MKNIAYAYIHGFKSSGNSTKGRAVKEMIPQFMLPTLYKDFNSFTVSDALRTMDRLHDREIQNRGTNDLKWRFVGSSLGGYVASKWAEMNPDCVDRLVLYCPALDIPALLTHVYDENALEAWKLEGSLEMDGPGGEPANLHYNFIRDAQENHNQIPSIPSHISTLIMHGERDEVIPLAHSEKFTSANNHVSLNAIKDGDHALTDHIPTLLFNTLKFLGNMEYKSELRSTIPLE